MLVWTTIWAFLQATEIYLNSCFLELLQTVQGNGSCSWNSLKRTFIYTEILDRLRSSKLSVLHREWSAIVQQGMYPCLFSRYLSASSLHCCEDFFTFEYLKQLCSICENVFSFVHSGRQKIRMRTEKHHCRLSNIQQ